jgi:hypothetical protein
VNNCLSCKAIYNRELDAPSKKCNCMIGFVEFLGVLTCRACDFSYSYFNYIKINDKL